jgi:hypothetical protein
MQKKHDYTSAHCIFNQDTSVSGRKVGRLCLPQRKPLPSSTANSTVGKYTRIRNTLYTLKVKSIRKGSENLLLSGVYPYGFSQSERRLANNIEGWLQIVLWPLSLSLQ